LKDLSVCLDHENQRAPPSLSDAGKLKFGSISDLLQCLEKLSSNNRHVPLDDAAVILDCAAIVQMLKTGCVKTFADYANEVFVPFMASQTATRVELDWDRYDNESLKATAGEYQGIGVRCHDAASIPVPRNWPALLRSNDNRTEFFSFLTKAVSDMPLEPGKQLVLTLECGVLTLPLRDYTSMLNPCTQEEADMRMILHAADAGQNGIKRIIIRTVDTDVVVLAIANKQHIACDALWIAFGAGKHFRYIAAHELAAALGASKAKALPVFHAFTGCDTISCFAGKGKKSAWETWNNFPAVRDAFLELLPPVSSHSPPKSNSCLTTTECFVVLLYDRTCN
jgi:hypothetical protein